VRLPHLVLDLCDDLFGLLGAPVREQPARLSGLKRRIARDPDREDRADGETGRQLSAPPAVPPMSSAERPGDESAGGSVRRRRDPRDRILAIRRFIPESPRWLLTHGRAEEAEQVVAEIENEVAEDAPAAPRAEGEALAVEQRGHIGFVSIAKYVVKNYPSRVRARVVAHGRTGVPLQRRVLTLHARAQQLSSTSSREGAALPDPVRGRKHPGPLTLGPALRLGRTQGDDLVHVHHFGRAADHHGLLFTHNVLSATTMTIAGR